MVIKRGNITGLTVGRANNIMSYAGYYYDGQEAEPSKEWAIISRDSKSGVFSDKGNSGSVIVDGLLNRRFWQHRFHGHHLRHTHQLQLEVHASEGTPT
jgi:hypothetical protein